MILQKVFFQKAQNVNSNFSSEKYFKSNFAKHEKMSKKFRDFSRLLRITDLCTGQGSGYK